MTDRFGFNGHNITLEVLKEFLCQALKKCNDVNDVEKYGMFLRRFLLFRHYVSKTPKHQTPTVFKLKLGDHSFYCFKFASSDKLKGQQKSIPHFAPCFLVTCKEITDIVGEKLFFTALGVFPSDERVPEEKGYIEVDGKGSSEPIPEVNSGAEDQFVEDDVDSEEANAFNALRAKEPICAAFFDHLQEKNAQKTLVVDAKFFRRLAVYAYAKISAENDMIRIWILHSFKYGRLDFYNFVLGHVAGSNQWAAYFAWKGQNRGTKSSASVDDGIDEVANRLALTDINCP